MKNNTLKIPVSILLAALTCFAIGIYTQLPWWSFAITNCLIAFVIPQKPWVSFVTGFIGIAAIWGGLAMGIDRANNHILATKVAQILPLNGSYSTLIFITAIVGGLVGGLAALTGAYLRKKS